MRRALAVFLAFAALTTVLGGVPAPARGSCSRNEYDDKCETRSLLIRTRVGIGVLPFYAPASRTLVAAGTVFDGDTFDIVVKAFDARSGRRRWFRSYGGGRDEFLTAGALGQGGRTLFVAGTTMRAGRRGDWVVVALSVRTGRLLWERTFGGRRRDIPTHLAFDARDDSIYVAGQVSRRTLTSAIVAYDASSGRRLWVRERRPRDHDVAVEGIELRGPDLYVLESGYYCRTSDCRGDGPRVTRGAPTRSGFRRVWTRPVSERQGTIQFGSAPLAASREGVAVGGTIGRGAGVDPYYTVSFYERGSARKRWTANPYPAGDPYDTFPLLAADPARRQVIVGDASVGTASSVRAIDTRMGRIRWERRFPDRDFAGTVYDVAAGRSGVYATGFAAGRNESISPVLVRFGPRAGRRTWVARYAAGYAWDEGVGSYLGAGRRGVTVVLGTPADSTGLDRDEWIGYATYRNGK